MIDPTSMEIKSYAISTPTIGRNVAEVGIKNLWEDYSKEEVLTLIEVVVTHTGFFNHK